MSTEEELKWMTKRYSWRYIPFRYQAMVATIVSAFLYFNIFKIFFTPATAGNQACGSLMRPILDNDDMGSLFSSGISFFTLNDVYRCPRTIQGLWWELVGTFIGLAICGLVMRRAIKRDEATKSS
jgi:hypothetical protein